MKWFKSKPVEPVTVESIRAERPDLSEETAQAVVDFHEYVNAQAGFGAWLVNDVAPFFLFYLNASLVLIGWFAVMDWIGSGQTVLDYALRVGWLILGLIGLGVWAGTRRDEE